jgi:hypothetical protein
MRRRLTNHPGNKEAAAGLRREISEDFKYDKKKIKHLQRILHNVTVALGTLNSALNEFSRIKGPAISPDGLLGGLGYIMPIKNVKEVLTTSVHNLSDVADSLADELTNPHWQAEEDKETKELIKEKEKVEEETQEILDKPEDFDVDVPEDSSEDINPDEIKTSEEIKVACADKVLLNYVKQALVRFSSTGKKI